MLTPIDDKDKRRFWSKVKIMDTPDCWIWQAGETRGGYGKFYLRGKTQISHRVSFMMLNGEIPEDRFVLHLCNNRKCVNPSHLMIGTHKENMEYMVACGRCYNGNQNGNRNRAKLTREQEIEIKSKYMAGITQRKLADEYKVCKATIYYALRRVS